MTPELVVSNFAHDNVGASLYLKPDGKYTVWLKVYAALLEIRESEFEDVIEVLLETVNDYQKDKEGLLHEPETV